MCVWGGGGGGGGSEFPVESKFTYPGEMIDFTNKERTSYKVTGFMFYFLSSIIILLLLCHSLPSALYSS